MSSICSQELQMLASSQSLLQITYQLKGSRDGSHWMWDRNC